MQSSQGCCWSSRPSRYLVVVGVALWTVTTSPQVTASELRGPYSCTTDLECQESVHELSECRRSSDEEEESFFCSNIYESGCFFALDDTHERKRVCNSEDSPAEVARGICEEPSDFVDYMELRIFDYNWETVHMEVWLLQVILSEFLNVPTSVETGIPGNKMNLYDSLRHFDGGSQLDRISLETAAQIGDCALLPYENRAPDSLIYTPEDIKDNTYIPCAHIATEMWDYEAVWEMAKDNLSIEAPQGLGVLGQEGWWVPKFTGEQEPSFLSYLGLKRPENRRKIAEAFLRPTTWADYCELVSEDQCKTPDAVAARPPADEGEGGHYFFMENGEYTGHFRATEDNDCDKWPLNCTGHIADYPCGWTSNVFQQAYHLDIPVRSNGPDQGGGYPYSSLVEMWHASNYTKSNLMMYWWYPDTLFDEFARTDAEFTRVTFPTPTEACTNNRVANDVRCHGNLTERGGDERGICDDPPLPLQKVVSIGLREATYDPSIPEALRSPAYDVAKLFTLTTLQLDNIFNYRKQYADPREALCRWAVDNKDWIQEFAPPSYPRSIRERSNASPLSRVALGLASLATLVVILAVVGVYRLRHHKVMKSAQIEFVALLLLGLILIPLGAIVIAAPATNGSCTVAVWLVSLGYTIELVPLLVRISAVNRLVLAARGHRRTGLNRNRLFLKVLIISVLVIVYLAVWTALDPPSAQKEFKLNTGSGDDDNVLDSTTFCASEKEQWSFVAIGWNLIMLFSGSLLAFQSRKIKLLDFNESLTVGLIVYSQTLFVILRIVINTVLKGQISQSALRSCESIIFSCDTLVTTLAYFFPKFRRAIKKKRNASSSYWNLISNSVVEQIKSAERSMRRSSLTGNKSKSFMTVQQLNKYDPSKLTPASDDELYLQAVPEPCASCPNCGHNLADVVVASHSETSSPNNCGGGGRNNNNLEDDVLQHHSETSTTMRCEIQKLEDEAPPQQAVVHRETAFSIANNSSKEEEEEEAKVQLASEEMVVVDIQDETSV